MSRRAIGVGIPHQPGAEKNGVNGVVVATYSAHNAELLRFSLTHSGFPNHQVTIGNPQRELPALVEELKPQAIIYEIYEPNPHIKGTSNIPPLSKIEEIQKEGTSVFLVTTSDDLYNKLSAEGKVSVRLLPFSPQEVVKEIQDYLASKESVSCPREREI